MATSTASTSNNRAYDPTALPDRWLDCPRKSTIIADRFIAVKTPLDDKFKDKIDIAKRWTCSMLITAVTKGEKKNLGLVIDLTNTDRFYDSDKEFKQKNVRYEKIRCRGHGETPNADQTNRFITVCSEFSTMNPDDIIAVHCTHGFNRTGFLICAYLCREHDMSIDAAIDIFAKARLPGIYKQDYLNELVKIFGDESSLMISAPPRPEWCLTNSDDEDEPNERPVVGRGIKRTQNNNYEQINKRPREDTRNTNPQFAVSLPGVTPICIEPTRTQIQLKCQRMCDWHGRGFPGSQPISMDITNYMTIVQSPYMVSWKADGTRYMMLIEDKNKIYMFDRDNSVFEISHVTFPKDPDYNSHLTNTLVDGELVLDNVDGKQVPRYLIYDITVYDNDNSIRTKPLKERLDCIRRQIIDVRNIAITKGLFDKSLEPFSIRNKDFWELSAINKLVGPKFRGQIAHEVDGLIFQPELDPYIAGRSPRVLKWKEDNTIDFLLKICVDNTKMGMLPQKKAYLFVNGLQKPFAEMPYSSTLRQYDNKIIECSYHHNQWHFHRQRTDKSFPNAKETAFGAIEALKNPITKEILCSLIDDQQRRNMHRELIN